MEVKINNKKFLYFTKVDISLKYDSVASTFTIDSYFNPDDPNHKELFKPLSFNKVVISENGLPLLTGTFLNNAFIEAAARQPTVIKGYSLPGVLEDSKIPTSLYPLQSDQRTLSEIIERLIKPYGITLVVDPDISSVANKKYPVTTANEKGSIKSYITELAAQRNLIITHNAAGQLLLTRVKSSLKPILNFKVDTTNKEEMALNTNGQPMHSEITVQKQADIDGENAGETTVNNPYVEVYRTEVKTQSTGTDVDTEAAAKNALSTEIKNIQLTIKLNRWDWLVNGTPEIITPGKIISVQSKDLYLYKKTNFFIEGVQLIGTHEEKTAVISCVLPEVYNGETPVNIFK